MLSNDDNKQCIAPFLIVLRVANRSALTSEAVASGSVGSIRFRSPGESTRADATLSNGNRDGLDQDARGEAPGEHGAGADNSINSREVLS